MPCRAPDRVSAAGTRYWYDAQARFHNEDDYPAIVYADGTRVWLRHGAYWRADGKPHEVWADGKQVWVDDAGEPHRAGPQPDLPAIVHGDGSRQWLRHGKHFREGGLPHEVDADGVPHWYDDHGVRLHLRDAHFVRMMARVTSLKATIRKWFEDGVCRHEIFEEHAGVVDGKPLVLTSEAWFDAQGKEHREDDLPAVIDDDGTKWWYTHGVLVKRVDADGTEQWVDDQKRKHRGGGLPAIVEPSGAKWWYTHGELQKSVVTTPEGDVLTRDADGLLHSFDDAPSKVCKDGTKHWHVRGVHGRADGKAHVEEPVGACTRSLWYDAEGRLHRDGGLPASMKPGVHVWYDHGVRTKEETFDSAGRLHSVGDKPAVWAADGTSVWYQHGKHWRDDPSAPHHVAADGSRYWYDSEGKLHRDGDLPAAIHGDGSQSWYCHGVRHRDGDKPAVMCADFTNEWYLGGVRTRTSGANGSRWYDSDGTLHRDDDLPAQIDADGTERWYRQGKLHRDGDKPAVIFANGAKKWFVDGEVHRDGDKPAIILADGTKKWFRKGELWWELYQKPTLAADEDDGPDFAKWHPVVIRARPNRCPMCKSAGPVPDPVVVCRTLGHVVCRDCLQGFMESINEANEPARCLVCRGLLVKHLTLHGP